MKRNLWLAAFFLMGGSTFAQEEQEFAWSGKSGEDVFVWMGGMELPDLPDLPGLPEFMSDMDADVEVDVMGMGDGKGLELTKEQRDKIHQIRTQTRKANIPLEADLKLKEMELHELVQMDTPAKDRIAAKVKEIETIRTQLRLNKLNGRIDQRNVLTKDQRDKLQEMKMMRRMRVHRFPGMHGRDGDGFKMKRFMIERDKDR